ncbi:MAG: carboxypeptidase-like regulatory domain-containing protein, partial [Singulisphaera sp.]
EGEAILKGTIRVPGGGPPPGPVPATAISRTGNGGGVQTLGPLKARFSTGVHAGRVWLSVGPEGFAPKVVGPFDAKPGAIIEGIDIVLEPGFPARVRVVDEHGAAVARARVNGGLSVDGSAAYRAQGLITDGDGVAKIAHAARGGYRMSVQARGFQVAEPVDVTLTPEGTTTLTLVFGPRGASSSPDGTAIAGATPRPFAKFSPISPTNMRRPSP